MWAPEGSWTPVPRCPWHVCSSPDLKRTTMIIIWWALVWWHLFWEARWVSCLKSITGKYVNIVAKKTRAGKKLFEQKALMASHRITCWLHQQTKYERGRIENKTNKQTTLKNNSIDEILFYHFQVEVSASQGRGQVDSSQGEQQERSRNSSRMWSFGSCSQVTRPGWTVLTTSRGWFWRFSSA